MSIVNGLFAGRAGINSHGAAIGVVGDNIANANTVGFKTNRAEFEDVIAGGQVTGRVIGSGSSVSSVTTIMTQGTLEFTNRPLDMAIDGNGLFVVANGSARYFTRAGNFKLDSAGYIVDQNGYALLGYETGGTGALQPLNINTVSAQSSKTNDVDISGNLDATESILTNGAADIPAAGSTYLELADAASYQTVVDVYDSLGASHSVSIFFYHTDDGEWVARGYVDGGEVDGGTTGIPTQIGTATLEFGSDGLRSNDPGSAASDFTATAAWSNGADQTAEVDFTFGPFTQFAANSNIGSITQDGQGVGSVQSVNVEQDGRIFALLDNGESAVIGTVALANFANVEGLSRIGNNLMVQSTESGEPIFGKPNAGTLGAIQAGSLELSTVDIANEFVKVISLQRGFQASSRIISTINQLLNEIVQLV